MRALWLERRTVAFREDVPLPELVESQTAIVRVRLAGICGTDLALLGGYYPYTGIPGHEFVGDVVATDDAAWIGQRVVGEINVGCGGCEECRRMGPAHCRFRKAIGIAGHAGAFAEYLSVPIANLHRVPDTVPDTAAVFTEPLAAALAIRQQVHVRPDDRVLLIGAGRLGQLIAQTLALTGCDLSVIARHPLQQQLLARQGIVSRTEDAPPAGLFDCVVEASGSPSGFALARRSIRPRGTLVLKSTYAGEVPVPLSSLVVDEIRVIGSRCGPFGPALRLLEQRRVDPTPLISGVYPLSAGIDALAAAREPSRLKILLSPDAALGGLKG
ncbi:MDR/zinc-dependent alcohol dehydrogenase-like family protein [Methylolobus aquaticus]